MFCPKCGTENIDDAKFCRACGANISLVPQALTGQLPQVNQHENFDWVAYYDYKKHRRPASLSHGVSQVFIGLAFLIITILLGMKDIGKGWYFWLLIPGFAMLGKGIGGVWQAKSDQRKSLRQSQTPQMNFQPSPQRAVSELPPQRNTTEFMTPPASVTEHTTRHLGAEVPTKVFNDKS